LKDQWAIEEIRGKIKNFLGSNENENITYQKVWDRAKAVLGRKNVATSTYIKNPGSSQINNLVMHIWVLEKQKQTKPKISMRKEIIKICATINEIETKKSI
jgi:hypothetical protein